MKKIAYQVWKPRQGQPTWEIYNAKKIGLW